MYAYIYECNLKFFEKPQKYVDKVETPFQLIKNMFINIIIYISHQFNNSKYL